MDDIVEEFLLEKLGQDIEGASKAAKDYGMIGSKCKLFSMHEECQELKNLMEKKKQGTGAAVKDTRREKLYYLLNLMAEWRELLEKQPRALLCPDDLPRKLKQVKKDLQEPRKDHTEQPSPETPQEPRKDHTEQPSPETPQVYRWSFPQVYRWSCHAVDLTKIHGFEDKCMIMERLLPNKASKVIGIVGAAGVGKTALCQLAYNHPPVQKHFLLRIWLCLSKNQKLDDAAHVQLKRTLSCLGFEDQVIQKVGDEKLQLALRHQLNRGRYLIVLDDVWTIQEADKVVVEEEVKKLFSFLTQLSSRYGGTLIVTSRSPELEKMVDPKNMHRLLPLADNESCWNIFTDAFEEDGTKLAEEMKNLKSNILEKCDGLPLMAKMLGKNRAP